MKQHDQHLKDWIAHTPVLHLMRWLNQVQVQRMTERDSARTEHGSSLINHST